MGLFGKRDRNNPATEVQPTGRRMRGGCSACDMRGPVRDTYSKASDDANAHNKRMHGSQGRNIYVEGGH